MLDDVTMRRMTGHQHTDEACESTRKLTYRDFVRFPDDGRRHELIDGVHYVTACPDFGHQLVLQRLNVALANHLKETRSGLVFFNFDCVFSFFDIVNPDLVVVLKDRFEIFTHRNIKGTPSILVEVLSPSTAKRDRTIKRTLYERHGLLEYWIIDETRKTISIERLGKRGFRKAEILRLEEDHILTCDLLPGFEMPLSELFNDDLMPRE